MSMNLHGEFDGRKFDFWQTPTYITYMIMTTVDESNLSKIKSAKLGLKLYKIWAAKSGNIVVLKNKEDEQRHKEEVEITRSHFRELDSLIETSKKIELFFL